MPSNLSSLLVLDCRRGHTCTELVEVFPAAANSAIKPFQTSFSGTGFIQEQRPIYAISYPPAIFPSYQHYA